MLRSLALAAYLLLTLLWTVTAWAEPERAATSSLVTGTAPIKADLGITTSVAVTGGKVITVTTTTDEVNNDGDCSLREAIKAADRDSVVDACSSGSGADTVYLVAGHYLLPLGQITLTSMITLQGSITETTILDGQGGSRVLYIQSEADVILLHLDIRNGRAPSDDCSHCGDTPGPPDGGGILNDGTTTIAYSTIHNNRAGLKGFAGDNPRNGADGGGIYNNGTLTIVNSTISGNYASSGVGGPTHGGTGGGCGFGGQGGGIANVGQLTLDNSTITENVPGSTNGNECDPDMLPFLNYRAGGLSTTTNVLSENSIIAGNQTRDCSGVITSGGNNLIQTTNGCTVSGSNVYWAPHLSPLQDNGGPTLTHALDKKSPAIDAGDCTDSTGVTVTVDQRGELRPQGEDCDIGAYESPYTSTFVIHDTRLPLIGD